MSWKITPGWLPSDADAAAYITAVETADGQALEQKTKIAIDNFVLGCKADGIWTAIKASCILAGARTLVGALVPLVGTAPTNNNFVSGDYNRKTGLVGNGSTKSLNSNRANNVEPQNSQHIAVYHSSTPATGAGYPALIGSETSGTPGTSSIRLDNPGNYWLGQIRNQSLTAMTSTSGRVAGFVGLSRGDSTSVVARANRSTLVISSTSQSPSSASILVFRDSNSDNHTSARLAFYSIGESLDLARLDARVTDLINAFAAAIP